MPLAVNDDEQHPDYSTLWTHLQHHTIPHHYGRTAWGMPARRERHQRLYNMISTPHQDREAPHLWTHLQRRTYGRTAWRMPRYGEQHPDYSTLWTHLQHHTMPHLYGRTVWRMPRNGEQHPDSGASGHTPMDASRSTTTGHTPMDTSRSTTSCHTSMAGLYGECQGTESGTRTAAHLDTHLWTHLQRRTYGHKPMDTSRSTTSMEEHTR